MVAPILPMAPMDIYEQDMTTPEYRAEYYKACWQKAAEKVVVQNELLKKYISDHNRRHLENWRSEYDECRCSLCMETRKEILNNG